MCSFIQSWNKCRPAKPAKEAFCPLPSKEGLPCYVPPKPRKKKPIVYSATMKTQVAKEARVVVSLLRVEEVLDGALYASSASS